MLERYSRPQMRAIWTLENQYRKWLEVEIAVCEGWAKLGVIPPQAVEAIKARASFSVERIAELEAQVRHDLIAFLQNVSEHLGDEARYLHLGLTSSDVKDTALALQLREAMGLILADVDSLIQVLETQALRYKDTAMIGRTHGVHAEPITWGLKLALWATEMKRHRGRLLRAREVVSVGKISGAVGTYATVDPRVEEYVCRKLGLVPAPISSQILQRDRHAEYVWALAVTAASLEKFATEIRNLQRTEILEVEEPFGRAQRGSSAMPHKRNPIVCERISGLARLFRGYLTAALEDIPLWHERDLTHSSVERVILPQATTLLDYMLDAFITLMRGLRVYPENMARNMNRTEGLIFSQHALLALVEKGMDRSEAYEVVQKAAQRAWQGEGRFKELLAAEPAVRERLTADELDSLFDLRHCLRHVDDIFRRLKGDVGSLAP